MSAFAGACQANGLTAQMTAGALSSGIGYDSSGGSLDQPKLKGATINAIKSDILFIINLDAGSALQQDHFTQVAIYTGSGTFLRTDTTASATFTNPTGTEYQWAWTVTPVFTNGISYVLYFS